MASITACTLRQGKKIKDKMGSDDHLSKVVELNGKYRLFFRTLEIEEGFRDIVAATVPGRSLDFKVCNASFIPYDATMYTQNDAGEIDDKTGLDSWARIARVLHQAQCTREKKNAEAEAQRTAAELGKPIDQVSLARAIEGIELKYNGGKAADGTRINATLSPAISGIQQKMTMQLLAVKLNADGSPDYANAKYAVLEVSKARMNEMLNLAENADYFSNDKDYFEVGYDYIGADKKSAGQAAKFQGITNDLSLEHAFPAQWAKDGKRLVDGLANGSKVEDVAEIVKSRNRNLKGGVSPKDVVSALKKYCANNAAIFGSIDYEDDATARSAKDFLDSHMLDSIPAVKAKFEELAAAQKKDNNDTESTVTEAAEAAAPVADTFTESEQKNLEQAKSVLDAGAAGQTLQQLASAVPDIDLTADEDADMGDL
jgi:hypothetical protein